MTRRTIVLAASTFLLAGCQWNKLVADNLTATMDDQKRSFYEEPSVAHARAGAPSLLKLLDGFLVSSPDNPELLVRAAELNCGFAMLLIEDEDPDYLLVFGADNIYRMDPRQMLEQHIDTGAAVTVAGIRKPRSEASEFGVIEQAADSTKIAAFHEKPADPPAVPGSPDESFISMGNYIFTREWLVETLRADAADDASVHDMGGNIIPALT